MHLVTLGALVFGCAALDGAPAAGAPAAPDSAGFVFRELALPGGRSRYAVWLPPHYDPRQQWPCIVFLHGSGESGTDGDKPTRAGLGHALRTHPERWPCIVLLPQKPLEEEEWEEREDLVLGVLREARASYTIDADRIALAGMSQGGHGTWMIAARHPQTWSCLVPICGYGRARTVAPRVAHLPVWAFHGLRDDIVDPRDTQQIVSEIQALRVRRGLVPDGPEGARMTLYPDLNHGSWDAALAEPELPGWILARRRPGSH